MDGTNAVQKQPKIFVVGTGPGSLDHMSGYARRAIELSDAVVGYSTYIDLLRPLLGGKEVISSGMRKERERCSETLQLALSGNTVCLVSSGDAGIYGMAGVMLETAEKYPADVEIEIVPGISAVSAAASILGAPLMHDFAVISLSDLMTPWSTIETRLHHAAAADFVIVLYNPKSKKRLGHIARAQEIIAESRTGDTPVGIVRNAMREDETAVVTTLGEMKDEKTDMFSLVIVGNSTSRVVHGRIVTPRGYSL